MRQRSQKHKGRIGEKTTKFSNKEKSLTPLNFFEMTCNPKLESKPTPKE
jgi:hypothetical protein